MAHGRKRPSRKDLRVAVDLDVTVLPKGGRGKLRCKTRDLSGSGMLIWSPKSLLLGTTLSVQFMAPDTGRNLYLAGVVRRVRPARDFARQPGYLVAVDFEQTSDAMLRHLRRVVTVSIMALVDRIRDLPAFSSLTEFDLLTLAGICHPLKLGEKEVLIRKGEEAGSLYIVVSGLVRLSVMGEGEEPDALELAGSGQVFGEVSALTGLPHDLDAFALEETELIAIPGDGIEHLKQAHPETALRLIEVFIRFTGMRLRRMTRKLFQPSRS